VIGNSEWGRRMRRIRGAHAANARMRAQGRIPGAEGREQIKRNREAHKAESERSPLERVGRTDLEGI
jgi:hypothetical protein